MALKYRWDDFVLDLDAFRLERSGVPLALEPKAFNLLVLLVERPGHLFSKQEIFERLWPGTAVTDHALTRVIAQLRRVLGDEARDARYIETVPTRGYRWLPIVTPDAGTAAHHEIPAATKPHAQGGVRRALVLPGLALALAVTTALVAMVAWTQRDTRSEAFSAAGLASRVLWPAQLTTNPGLDLHPSFSPQGDAVVYASDRTGAFELYVRPLNGPVAEVALTADRQHNVQPAWSPDGTQIAFHSHGRGGIWILPSRGGAARQLVTEGSHPAWSADGTRVAFQSDEPSDVTPSAFGAHSGATIKIVDADGSNERPLTTPGRPLGGHAAPAWTRDGRFIAFTVFEGASANGVWLASAETGEARQLLSAARGLYELAFAPDDSAIYVAGGEPLITRIPFDPRAGTAGASEVMPVPGVSGVRGIAVSPDGDLGFGGLSISSQIWAQPVDANGNGRGAPRALTTDTSRRNSQPAVSPDGARVAYVSTRAGEGPNLWAVGTDGKQVTQLTADNDADKKPLWFDDGRKVAFLSSGRGEIELRAVDLETRRESALAGLGGIAEQIQAAANGRLAEPAMSPSLTQVAFAVITPPLANRQIYVGDISKRSTRLVSDRSDWVGYPAWSRNERQLAVEEKDGSSTHAAVLDLDTGALRRLTHDRGQTWVRSWSPDGRKIAAAVFRIGQWDLRWIDASSGATGVITAAAAPNTYVRYPEWSPRGDLVVYERGELRGNVWVLRIGKHVN